MTESKFVATILGVKDNSAIVEVNIRSGPGVNNSILFKSLVGTAGLPIQDVMPDQEQNGLGGKVYQWLQLRFPDGRVGWARDDLVGVQGDGSLLGYGVVAAPTRAFELTRVIVSRSVTPPPAPAAPSAPPPAPPPAPAAPSISTPPAAPQGCIGFVNARSTANMRSGPGTNHPIVLTLNRGNQVKVTGAISDDAGGQLRWAQVNVQGQSGWMREDTLRYDGDCDSYGLSKRDLYVSPMVNCWWVRGFEGPNGHWGWDLGANVGEPVIAGQQGGFVLKSFQCTRCTDAKPSFLDHGFPLGDSRALSDPAWGFGYGHYVIVRYLNDQLPASTRDYLAGRGLAGAHIFTMYAHLSKRTVGEGQTLAGSAMIGACGNSGNSEAPHLHLEIRASANAGETQWANMKPNLLDPFILFKR